MMAQERANIQARSEAFQRRIDQYRDRFRQSPMFAFATGPERAYELIDQTYREVGSVGGELGGREGGRKAGMKSPD